MRLVLLIIFVAVALAEVPGLRGRYFATPTFTDLRVVRLDDQIEFYWRYDRPALGMPADRFSVRWSGFLLSTEIAGNYTFSAAVDDAVNVTVDGELVIARGVLSSRDATGVKYLEARTKYSIVVEYVENVDTATMVLSWSYGTVPKTVIPASQFTSESLPVPPSGEGTGLLGRYYARPGRRDLAAIRTDSAVYFHWGQGNPVPGVNGGGVGLDGKSNRFSVCWTGQLLPQFTTKYTFHANVDGDVELKINTFTVLNAGNNTEPNEHASEGVSLVAGRQVPIQICYQQVELKAHCILSWSCNSLCEKVPVPSSQLFPEAIPAPVVGTGSGLRGYYYADHEQTDLRMLRIDRGLDFEWLTASPDLAMPSDQFSIRWEGMITPEYSTQYTFHVLADDAFNLTVGNLPVVRSATANTPGWGATGVATLDVGQPTQFSVEFFEFTRRASLQVFWSCEFSAKAFIPSQQLSSPPFPDAFIGDGTGINAWYYIGVDPLRRSLAFTRLDPTPSFLWGTGSPAADIPNDGFSVRWVGKMTAMYTALHTFYIDADDAVRFEVDGFELISQSGPSAQASQAPLHLVAGQTYDILLEYSEIDHAASCQLSWSSDYHARQPIPTTQLGATGVTVQPTVRVVYTPPKRTIEYFQVIEGKQVNVTGVSNLRSGWVEIAFTAKDTLDNFKVFASSNYDRVEVFYAKDTDTFGVPETDAILSKGETDLVFFFVWGFGYYDDRFLYLRCQYDRNGVAEEEIFRDVFVPNVGLPPLIGAPFKLQTSPTAPLNPGKAVWVSVSLLGVVTVQNLRLVVKPWPGVLVRYPGHNETYQPKEAFVGTLLKGEDWHADFLIEIEHQKGSTDRYILETDFHFDYDGAPKIWREEITTTTQFSQFGFRLLSDVVARVEAGSRGWATVNIHTDHTLHNFELTVIDSWGLIITYPGGRSFTSLYKSSLSETATANTTDVATFRIQVPSGYTSGIVAMKAEITYNDGKFNDNLVDIVTLLVDVQGPYSSYSPVPPTNRTVSLKQATPYDGGDARQAHTLQARASKPDMKVVERRLTPVRPGSSPAIAISLASLTTSNITEINALVTTKAPNTGLRISYTYKTATTIPVGGADGWGGLEADFSSGERWGGGGDGVGGGGSDGTFAALENAKVLTGGSVGYVLFYAAAADDSEDQEVELLLAVTYKKGKVSYRFEEDLVLPIESYSLSLESFDLAMMLRGQSTYHSVTLRHKPEEEFRNITLRFTKFPKGFSVFVDRPLTPQHIALNITSVTTTTTVRNDSQTLQELVGSTRVDNNTEMIVVLPETNLTVTYITKVTTAESEVTVYEAIPFRIVPPANGSGSFQFMTVLSYEQRGVSGNGQWKQSFRVQPLSLTVLGRSVWSEAQTIDAVLPPRTPVVSSSMKSSSALSALIHCALLLVGLLM